jgi:hypothetical protein
MLNRYNRSEFYKTENVNGILEKDLLQSKINSYKFKYPFKSYRLQYEDYLRPDLLSRRIFGTQEYWWIILRVNPGLDDIWNDFGYSDDVVEVLASEIDPSINKTNDHLVLVDAKEYYFKQAYKVGELINIPDTRDITDLYTHLRA